MMSATDLVTFARAHMPGNARSAGRILSDEGIKAMQQVTVNNEGKGYTYADGMGIGWMVFKNGLLHHSGGGPGIASALYVHPERRWAVALLTNAEYGLSLSLINELVGPWLAERNVQPFGTADVIGCDDKIAGDLRKYIGTYGDILHRYVVTAEPDGLALSKKMMFAPYENMSTVPGPPIPLRPVTDGRFLLEHDGDPGGSSNAFYRIFTFRNPDNEGRMQHLGNGLRLYKRVDSSPATSMYESCAQTTRELHRP